MGKKIESNFVIFFLEKYIEMRMVGNNSRVDIKNKKINK